MSMAEQAFTSSTVVTLNEDYTAKAARGAELKELISKAKKELEGIDKVFKGLFDQTGQRTFLNPAGKPVVEIAHGERHILDQPKLKAEKPEIVEAFQTLSTWDTPNYKA